MGNLAMRRLRREPVARIVGVKEFWSLPIAVSPATLVPRPETETLIEAALEIVEAEGASERPLRIVDLGTGSGAILLALLSELPGARGVGTDVSLDALKTARANAERLGFADRTGFTACDYGAALAGPFDLVVSNPPYIRLADIAGLAPEVRDNDPLRALDGGADGLDAYRVIAADTARLIGPRGHLLVELGAGQADAVAALFAACGLQSGNARPDLAGVPRVLHIRVPEKR
jgi:release factor glutamine methyltransferase